MKFTQVTWYYKVLALALFVALPFIGFWAGMWYQKNISPESTITTNDSNVATDSASKNDWVEIIESEEITVQIKHENGVLKYKGTVQVPTACYKLSDETTVLESFPEQVEIRITINEPESGVICAQVFTDKEFSGQVQVSEKATVSVFLNDEKVEQ
jgi:hypothetical protein